MQTRFIKRAASGAMAVAAILATGAAQAALQSRDLNGDTVTDAFYDTDLNITWLRDANVNGRMNWFAAVGWADSFSFGGYTDWRLPTSDTCSGFNCIGSEMGHLWYADLGNLAGAMTNTGDFQNLQSDIYWSGLDAGFLDSAWYFGTYNGTQGYVFRSSPVYAMAVRPGDVATAIPEPESYALMLAGLAVLALARLQQRR